MSYKTLSLALISTIVLSTGLAIAETTIQQIQSPIYTDEIGRSHFLGRGGYSSVRHIDMGQAQADMINDVDKQFSKKEAQVKETVNNTKDAVETDIMNVIKEKENVPVSAKTKATFTAEERKMDATAPYGYGNTNIPAGVNESKTIYTDELGRIHFFGKANKFKD